MSELGAWTIVVSWAVAAAAISMVTLETEHETRAALATGLRKVMAHLQGRFRSQPARTSRRTMGAFKRRSARPGAAIERRSCARRRLEDLFPSLKRRRSRV